MAGATRPPQLVGGDIPAIGIGLPGQQLLRSLAGLGRTQHRYQVRAERDRSLPGLGLRVVLFDHLPGHGDARGADVGDTGGRASPIRNRAPLFTAADAEFFDALPLLAPVTVVRLGEPAKPPRRPGRARTEC